MVTCKGLGALRGRSSVAFDTTFGTSKGERTRRAAVSICLTRLHRRGHESTFHFAAGTGILGIILLAACTKTEPVSAPAGPTASTTAPTPTYPTRAYFGDTHLHTALSLDAGAAGARLLPPDAYRFAKGEEVTGASGQKAKLARPLDFLVVTDHSDQMGLITDLLAGKPELLRVPEAKHWYDLMNSGKGQQAMMEIVTSFAQGKFPKALQYNPGTQGYRRHLDGDHPGGRRSQRARQVHRLYRLRVDLAGHWQQPASQRPVSRQRRQGAPGRAVHQLPAGQFQPAGSVEVDGRLRIQDRRPGAGDCAQRQPQQRHDVPADRVVHRQADRSGVRAHARAARAHLRSDPDQGRRRDRSIPVAQ